MDDLLSESRLRKRGIFQPDAVRSLVQQHRSGVQDWSMQIWQLLTFEIWTEQFIDSNVKSMTPYPSDAESGRPWNGQRAAHTS